MNPNPYLPPQTDPSLHHEPPVLATLVGEDGGMSIDFEIGREDLVAFSLFHHRSSPANRQRLRLAMVALSLIMATVLALLVYYALRQPEYWLPAVVVVMALVFVLVRFPQIQERNLRNLVERMYGEGRNLLLYGPRRVGLSPQFLNNSSPYFQSVTRWIAVEKIAVSENALYIYNSSVSSVIVPRRAFSSDDHFQTFVHTAQEFHARALAAENPLSIAVT
jgi:hypothetical protein